MPIVTLADLSYTRQAHGEKFETFFASITAGTGAEHLGARLIEVPPGKRAWPMHNHHNNDEMFVILAGSGLLRYGAETVPVAPGQVVVCPAGGIEAAHQLINTGEGPLRYLAVSSMRHPDVMEYPDSSKIVAFAGAAPGGDKDKRRLSLTLRKDSEVDYWDGEE